MEINKKHIRKVLKDYMLQNNLGYLELSASLSMDQQKIIMSLTEEEDDINDAFRWN